MRMRSGSKGTIGCVFMRELYEEVKGEARRFYSTHPRLRHEVPHVSRLLLVEIRLCGSHPATVSLARVPGVSPRERHDCPDHHAIMGVHGCCLRSLRFVKMT